MKKIAINRCFGGFCLSSEAMIMYLKKTFPNGNITTESDEYGFSRYLVDGEEVYEFEVSDYNNRENPILIKVIETLGEKANGSHSKIKIVEIPDDVKYEITDYDGKETIEEVHSVWY